MSGLHFGGVRGDDTAGAATVAPEDAGFKDEEDETQRYRCEGGGHGLRGMCTHGAEGDEDEEEG